MSNSFLRLVAMAIAVLGSGAAEAVAAPSNAYELFRARYPEFGLSSGASVTVREATDRTTLQAAIASAGDTRATTSSY